MLSGLLLKFHECDRVQKILNFRFPRDRYGQCFSSPRNRENTVDHFRDVFRKTIRLGELGFRCCDHHTRRNHGFSLP